MKEISGAFKCNFETSNVKQTGNCVVVFSVDLVSSNLIKFYQEKKKKEIRNLPETAAAFNASGKKSEPLTPTL